MEKEDSVQKEGKATFVIRVLYRQNATWQGTVHWVEENKDSSFRSELELMHLIESANKRRMAPEGFVSSETGREE